MHETIAREQILKRIRSANMQSINNTYSDVDLKSDIYPPIVDDLDITFAQNLNKLSGHFVYCSDKNEFVDNISRLFKAQKITKVHIKDRSIASILRNLDVEISESESRAENIKITITSCESLVARLGSILVSSKQESGRSFNFIPETHIVIANRSQIVATVKDAMALLQEKYGDDLPSMVSLISGPRRTADIEKTLVLGANGPRSLIVYLTEENIL